MTSLLDRALKEKIARGFKGRLTKGTLRRDQSTTTDSDGNPIPGTPLTFTIEGIRENFSLYTKANSGIPETDVPILIILGLVKPETIPVKDDKIFLATPWNRWHQVRRVLEIDPAGASCRVQAYEIPAP